MCPFMCPFHASLHVPLHVPWLRWLRSQSPPGCFPLCAPVCAPGSVGSGARSLRDASLHVPLHVPLALLAPGPDSSRMCPFMCPWLRWLRSQIPPGCFPSCAPVCAPGSAGSGARFLPDASLHVPLAPLAPGPDPSRMLPFMCPCVCPWLRWLRGQIPPGCFPSCAPGPF